MQLFELTIPAVFSKNKKHKRNGPQAVVRYVKIIADSDEGAFLSDIIMDDGATTMAQLRYKADGGNLPDNTPVPKKEGM
eukprot:4525213-Ditylum_brightwellii.AAC.1